VKKEFEGSLDNGVLPRGERSLQVKRARRRHPKKAEERAGKGEKTTMLGKMKKKKVVAVRKLDCGYQGTLHI